MKQTTLIIPSGSPQHPSDGVVGSNGPKARSPQCCLPCSRRPSALQESYASYPLKLAKRLLPIVLAGKLIHSGIAAEALRAEKGKWEPVEARQVSDLGTLPPTAPSQLSKYGGLASRRFSPTGFFRTEKIEGRWWLVDPEGCLFLSVGINSVNLSQSKGSLEPGGYASKAAWADSTSHWIRAHAFNTLGCWSDWQEFSGSARMPYTIRGNFMSSFAAKLGVAKEGFGNWKYNNDCMPVFHPDFPAHCEENARELTATKNDPFLLGYFSDNELPFRPDSLDNYLALPPADSGFQAARHWLDQRQKSASGKPRESIGAEDRDAFLEFLVHKYYSIVGSAIRRHDPHHLYLGSRIHGKCISVPVFKGSTPLDVVSVNYYHRWAPEPEKLAEISRISGHPVLITEFYAMKMETPTTETQGAGWRVATEEDRANFYQNFTLGLLEIPACVGWHWFKYGGDEAGKEIGTVDASYKPHEILVKSMAELNTRVYPIATASAKSIHTKELPVRNGSEAFDRAFKKAPVNEQ